MNSSLEISVEKIIKKLSILNEKNIPIIANRLSPIGNVQHPIGYIDLNLTDSVDFNISTESTTKQIVIQELLDSLLCVKDKNVSVFIYNIDYGERNSISSIEIINSILYLNYKLFLNIKYWFVNFFQN